MKTRMAGGMVTAMGALALLWCCNQTPTEPPASHVQTAPQPIPSSVPPPPATRPVAAPTTKPRILGPTGPAIVVLPAQIAEPQIRVCLISLGEHQGPISVPRNKYRGTVQSVRLETGRLCRHQHPPS